MRDLRQSKTFQPYRATVNEGYIDENGEIQTREVHKGRRFGYMSQKFKAELFGVARDSLQPGNQESVRRLSLMANYLTTINVENFSWMVGSHLRKDPATVQKAMEQMYSPDGPYDPITQTDAIRYARFGRSSLQLVRVPTVEDEAVYDTTQLPFALEITSSPGPEMLLGFSETIITTTYPFPLTSEY